MIDFTVFLSLLWASHEVSPPDEHSATVAKSPEETLRDWSRKLVDAKFAESQKYKVFRKWGGGLPNPAMLEIYEARITGIDKKSKGLRDQIDKFIGMETRFTEGIARIDKAPENQKTARTIDALQAMVNEGIASQKVKQLLAQGAPRRESISEMNRLLQLITQEVVTERSLLRELNDMRQTQVKLAADLREAIAAEQIFRFRLTVIDAATFVVERAQSLMPAESLKK